MRIYPILWMMVFLSLSGCRYSSYSSCYGEGNSCWLFGGVSKSIDGGVVAILGQPDSAEINSYKNSNVTTEVWQCGPNRWCRRERTHSNFSEDTKMRWGDPYYRNYDYWYYP